MKVWTLEEMLESAFGSSSNMAILFQMVPPEVRKQLIRAFTTGAVILAANIDDENAAPKETIDAITVAANKWLDEIPYLVNKLGK